MKIHATVDEHTCSSLPNVTAEADDGPTTEPAPKPPRRMGRPRRGEERAIAWSTIDRLLVHGEQTKDPATGHELHRYPSIKGLAARFDISRTMIWKYAQRHNCYDRRKEARLKTNARVDEKIVEKLSNARATATVDVIRIVDRFLLGFERELSEGRVKTDSAADFDRLTRLRELVTGGADARTELQGGISLAAIQNRHAVHRGLAQRLTPELTGTEARVEPEAELEPEEGSDGADP